MSLTSRFFGLFTTTETSSSSSEPLSSAQNGSTFAPTTTAGSPMNGGIGSVSPSEVEEEEPRPPYLHVCAIILDRVGLLLD